MSKNSTTLSVLKNKEKTLETCFNVENEGKEEMAETAEMEETGETEVSANIFIHVYNVEGQEFTSYTTFHGMIRIFNSNTWTSLIYWSFVVMICLTFYCFYSFGIIYRYAKKPTYQTIDHSTYDSHEMIYPQIIICPVKPYSQIAINDYANYDMENLEDLTWRPTRWHLSEFNDGKTNLTIDNVNFLQNKTFKNCYEIIERTIIDKIDLNLCNYTETANTTQTYCLAFDLNKIKTGFNELKIGFKNQDDAGYRIYIEPYSAHPLTYSNFFHLMPNTRMSVYTKLRNNTFLPKESGGNCLSNWEAIPAAKTMQIHNNLLYSIKLCEQIMAANLTLSTKNCIPYSLKELFNKEFPICNDTMNVLLDDNLVKNLHHFQCFPECNKLEYTFLRTSTRFMNSGSFKRNISMLKLFVDKNIKVIRSQSRLIYIVDVLSKIGGNTSLFCGFSCVTLMETFIFLFKSIVHLAYYGNRDVSEKEQLKKRPSPKLIFVESDNDKTTFRTDFDSIKEIYHSLPSSPVVKTAPISTSRKNSPCSIQDETAKMPIIDTISEKDESENERIPSIPEVPREKKPVTPFRRQQTTEKFRDSINSMTFNTKNRVNEPFPAFQARIEKGSLSNPMQPLLSKKSISSIGPYSFKKRNSNGRRQSAVPNFRPSPMKRYNSGVADF